MNLTQDEWRERLNNDDNAVILDVRTREEWDEGVIPNALLMDIYKGSAFIEEVKTLDKSKNYYVYCKAGGRSQQACHIMNQLGFDNTYNLSSGFMSWTGKSTLPDK